MLSYMSTLLSLRTPYTPARRNTKNGLRGFWARKQVQRIAKAMRWFCWCRIASKRPHDSFVLRRLGVYIHTRL